MQKDYSPADLDLDNLFILVTNVCNLTCKHCYVSSNPKGEYGLDFSTIRKISKEFRELFGRRTLTLSGGELFMRKNITTLIQELVEDHDVFILTNGTLLSKELIKNLPSRGIAFRIGLDGVSSLTHDFMRGKGTLNKSIKGLTNLVESGYKPGQIEIFYTAIPENLDEIEMLFSFADKFSIMRMIIEPVSVHGRAALYWEKTKPMGEDPFRNNFKNIIERVFNNHVTGWKYRPISTTFKTLTVYFDGKTYPFTPVNSFDEQIGLLGNIRNNSLNEVLDFKKYQTASLIKSMNYLKNKGDTLSAIRAFKNTDNPMVQYA